MDTVWLLVESDVRRLAGHANELPFAALLKYAPIVQSRARGYLQSSHAADSCCSIPWEPVVVEAVSLPSADGETSCSAAAGSVFVEGVSE